MSYITDETDEGFDIERQEIEDLNLIVKSGPYTEEVEEDLKQEILDKLEEVTIELEFTDD